MDINMDVNMVMNVVVKHVNNNLKTTEMSLNVEIVGSFFNKNGILKKFVQNIVIQIIDINKFYECIYFKELKEKMNYLCSLNNKFNEKIYNN